eukprot:403336296
MSYQNNFIFKNAQERAVFAQQKNQFLDSFKTALQQKPIEQKQQDTSNWGFPSQQSQNQSQNQPKQGYQKYYKKQENVDVGGDFMKNNESFKKKRQWGKNKQKQDPDNKQGKLRHFKWQNGEERKQVINLELLNADYFIIKFYNFYDNSLIQMIKQFKMKQQIRDYVTYDGQYKYWKVRLELYNDAFEMLTDYVEKYNGKQEELQRQAKKENGSDKVQNLILTPIPSFVFDMQQNDIPFSRSYLFEESFGKGYNLDLLPQNLRETLFQFQKDGVSFGIQRFGRFLLGDEMGVGKTVQALAVSCIFRDDWPLLVICPSSLRYTWYDEILKWLQDIRPSEICLIKSGKESIMNDAKIYIISYEIASKITDQFVKRGIRFTIVDEAHYLKAHNSVRSKNLVPILSRMKRLVLLSGTPMLARPAELFNLLKMVRPDIFQEFFSYATRYCNPKESQYGMDYTGASNIKELHHILEGKIMIRRLKKDVLKDLPPKIRQKIVVQTDKKYLMQIRAILKRDLSDAEERKNLENIIKDRNRRLAQQDQISINGVSTEFQRDPQAELDDSEEKQLSKVYQLTGKAKLKGIIEYVDYMIENQVKFILFAHHQHVMSELENHLINRIQETENSQNLIPPKYIRIDGTTPTDIRHDLVREFQEDESVRVALLSITSSSQGITLTAASTVIFAEVHWTPALMMQAEDRAHRIGQNECVNIYYLYGKETLDEILFPMIKLKSTVIARTLDDSKTDFKIKVNKKAKNGLEDSQQPDYQLKSQLSSQIVVQNKNQEVKQANELQLSQKSKFKISYEEFKQQRLSQGYDYEVNKNDKQALYEYKKRYQKYYFKKYGKKIRLSKICREYDNPEYDSDYSPPESDDSSLLESSFDEEQIQEDDINHGLLDHKNPLRQQQDEDEDHQKEQFKINESDLYQYQEEEQEETEEQQEELKAILQTINQQQQDSQSDQKQINQITKTTNSRQNEQEVSQIKEQKCNIDKIVQKLQQKQSLPPIPEVESTFEQSCTDSQRYTQNNKTLYQPSHQPQPQKIDSKRIQQQSVQNNYRKQTHSIPVNKQSYQQKQTQDTILI